MNAFCDYCRPFFSATVFAKLFQQDPFGRYAINDILKGTQKLGFIFFTELNKLL